MRILGIDTSCDDTCIALFEIKDLRFKILSNIISSQIKLHAKYGGVYPFLAKREHQRNLPFVLNKVLKKAGFVSSKQISNIDIIAVTVGPGLEPCLWQGINFAKELAEKLKIPIIPVNHIEAHILANLLPQIGSKSKINPSPFPMDWGKNQKSKIQIKNKKIKFPAVCLVVSGGHTQLILMKDIGNYKLIGETRDDAAGECFDKAARILGLGYPGGPAIAEQARRWKSDHNPFPMGWVAQPRPLEKGRGCDEISLPRPMIYQKNYDFSFSGLKTAVFYNFRSQPPKVRKSKEYIRTICRDIQQAIVDVLIHKTLKAARDFGVKSIILGGGVAANDELCKQFNLRLATYDLRLNFFAPAKKFCTDNAAMVAATAYFHQKMTTRDFEKIKANANLKI